MNPKNISCAEARRLIDSGARLVDIRTTDEYARAHIPGALHLPLGEIDRLHADGPVIFHCRSGARTTIHAAQLAAAADGACYVLAGGLEAWRQAGLEVAVDPRQPLELMRQVQLVAGALVLLGVVLGFLLSPGFFALPAFVGAGLMFAGATGWCGMAQLLRRLPWNRRMAA